jgi:L-seryl-tRNA(Sec) selenium transferase
MTDAGPLLPGAAGPLMPGAAGPLTLGTAGHIDHGKTALIGALTGVNTDRLPEEQARGISVVLGYAPLRTPSGRSLSVIDVPGHERFVRTMVAGATGIDMFLMVVAADDGVMPQTVEHAGILKVLGVRRGIIAVTKSDLIEPQPAMEEARKLLPDLEIVGCSAQTGAGLEELRAAVDRLAACVPSRAGVPQGVVLHIDRAFTISGRGTVVTGTLWSGTISHGDTLELLPAGTRVRVRGIEVHNQPLPRAQAGQRVAVNLTGVHFRDVHRGDALAEPGSLRATSTLDCRLDLSGAKHNMQVIVHHGTRHALGRLAALEGDLWQLRLERPLLANSADRLVVRRPAPPQTLGGGIILDAHATQHGPRPEILKRLRNPSQHLNARHPGEPHPGGQHPDEQPDGQHPGDSEHNSIPERLRNLPSVDQLADVLLQDRVSGSGPTPAEAAAAARAVLAKHREEILSGHLAEQSTEPDLKALAHEWLKPSLRRVLNGTGVVVHTNLGRAPLANSAAEAVNALARGYLNLDLDLTTGQRTSRNTHLAELLCELTGAQDAIAVNNSAAAVLLAVATLAGPDRPIAVSRGHLVEIGGGFRMPEIIAQTGTRLIEVGTTNRTRPSDYQQALDAGAKVIMRVHPSNFQTLGYTSEVDIQTLCGLGVPVIDDIGSGVLAENMPLLAPEPSIRRSISAGATIVCFSGDKLLGGPQAGIMLGAKAAIDACREHPLARALRIGRLPLAALEATLRLYRDPERALNEIPVLAMLSVDPIRLWHRAKTLAWKTDGELIETTARIGGGALPLLELTGPAVALKDHGKPTRLAAALRNADPPLLTRIHDHRVLVDPRTLPDNALSAAANVIRQTLDSLMGSDHASAGRSPSPAAPPAQSPEDVTDDQLQNNEDNVNQLER